MVKKETVSTWKDQSTETDVLAIKTEQQRQRMESRISKESRRADLILLICALVLFAVVILTFILCFETWAVDSPVGFLIWDKKWWGL
ncbi:hypothetical protein FAI40_02670 [Acetobacteraceae bacterium]|nr:hypothetical protein FAI40_02670 [Acetobacteraceae bacterium]